MAEMLINNWGGIGNDEYLQTGSDLFDAVDIDLSTTRRIKSIGAYDRGTVFRSSTGDYLCMKYTRNLYNHVISYKDDAKIWDGTTLRSIGYNSWTHETIGTESGAYDEITASSKMRHFFIPYNEGRIAYANYNGTSIGTIDITGVPRLNDASLTPGASCYIWKGALIFSYGNGIHELNPSTNTPVYIGEKVTLPQGANVKHIAYFGGLVWFVYTLSGKNSTFIQGCSYDGTSYKLNNYVTEISGQMCIGATSNSGIIYWVSEDSINEFDGATNNVVKTLYQRNGITDYFYSPSDSPNAICSYNEGFLRIIGVNKVFSWGNKRTGFTKNLIERKLDTGYQTMALGNDGYSIVHNLGFHRISLISSTYNASSYIVTMPYTAGNYSLNKEGLGIRIGYNLKKTFGGSITVSIITDAIIRDKTPPEEYGDYVELLTITDSSKSYQDIPPTKIAEKLGQAGYSNQFSLMKLKLDLNNGGQVTGPNGEIRFSNSPEIFDIYIYHEETKQ